jgi:hypothetical protein
MTKSAQEMVDGFPKGSGKNRAQHVLEAAHLEGNIQSAYEVLKLIGNKQEDPYITVANLTAWANATIAVSAETEVT